MRILSWNVQYGKSCDGVFDLTKTLQHITSLGEFDVICLQELARHMPDYVTETLPDQLAVIEQTFADYSVIWGAGLSWPALHGPGSARQEFGNASLVRNGLQDFRVHQLPLPAAPDNYQMQRVAIETIVDTARGPLSIINTHLAFHDHDENQLQLERLCELERNRAARYQNPSAIGSGAYQAGFPPFASLLCGDFNFTPDTTQYRYQLDMNWLDAWCIHNQEAIPPATCGIFDHAQWPQGAHCRDYFWLSQEFRALTTHAVVHASSKRCKVGMTSDSAAPTQARIKSNVPAVVLTAKLSAAHRVASVARLQDIMAADLTSLGDAKERRIPAGMMPNP